MKRRAPRISAGIALVFLSLVSPAAAIEEADRLWLVGERAFADGLYPASRRALERFVAQYPKDARQPEAVLLLGKARLQAGDAPAAPDAFQRAPMATPRPRRPRARWPISSGRPRRWRCSPTFPASIRPRRSSPTPSSGAAGSRARPAPIRAAAWPNCARFSPPTRITRRRPPRGD